MHSNDICTMMNTLRLYACCETLSPIELLRILCTVLMAYQHLARDEDPTLQQTIRDLWAQIMIASEAGK